MSPQKLSSACDWLQDYLQDMAVIYACLLLAWVALRTAWSYYFKADEKRPLQPMRAEDWYLDPPTPDNK